MTTKRHTPPTKVDGVPVEVMGDPLTMAGEDWVTLVPEGEDERLWEWSLTTGRLLLTNPAP